MNGSTSRRRFRVGRVAALGAAAGGIIALSAACVPPQPQTLAVTTAFADAPMGNAPLSETPVTVNCPAGSKLLSGGSRQWRTEGGTANNGLKMNGTLPSDSAGNPASDDSSDPSSWTAVGGFGGQSEAGDQVRSYALCATSVVTSVTVRTVTASATGLVTTSCPAGTRLVGGGARTTPAGNGSLKPVGSFPSDAVGNPSPDGATNPDSWSAVGNRAVGDNSPATTTVFALCATGLTNTVTVARAEGEVNPWSPSTEVRQTATCPAGTVLVAGGSRIDNGTPTPPQQGLHLLGNYPSDSDGTPAASGPSPSSWSTVAGSGGQGAKGFVRAFALCANP